MRFLAKQGSQYLFMSKNYFIFEANRQIRLHFGGLLMPTFKWVKIHVMQPSVRQASPYLMWSKNQEKSRSNSPFGSWKNARHICAIFHACSFMPVDTQALIFLHFAVKLDIKLRWMHRHPVS